MDLTQELEKFKEGFVAQAPDEVKLEMEKAQAALLEEQVGESAIKVGEIFPDFELENINREATSRAKLLGGRDFLVIAFYRGGWCPYCNLELVSLESHLEKFKELGANLVAITPETPDNSMSTSEKNELTFEVLTDFNSELAKKINIAFDLPENLKPIYEEFGINVQKHNGNFTLPVPATFIIDKEGRVVYEFLDIDYTKRLDPKEIIEALKK